MEKHLKLKTVVSWEVLTALEKGKLNSVATKAKLAKFKAAARATAVKARRVNSTLPAVLWSILHE